MSKPSFVELGAPQTFAAPYDMRECRSYGFMLKADIDALNRFCDAYLNVVAPPEAEERYRAAMDRVMFVYSDMGRALIGADTGYRQFTVPEIDVAFWIPVVAVRKSGGGESVSRFLWLMTYVNVDNIWATASGREVYGFPKGLASVTSVGDPGRLELLKLNTMAVERFGPEARPGLGLASQFGELIRHRRYPLVFLKQFRDVTDSTKACYQAVVEAPVMIGAFRGARLVAGDYRLDIEKLESHPVLEELGLESHEPRVLTGFYSDFDFVMGCWSTVWERR